MLYIEPFYSAVSTFKINVIFLLAFQNYGFAYACSKIVQLGNYSMTPVVHAGIWVFVLIFVIGSGQVFFPRLAWISQHKVFSIQICKYTQLPLGVI